MLYPKKPEGALDKALFQNPTARYRGFPFWSWNCKLDRELLSRQIDVFEKMGFGGYYAHSRTGLDTEYLGEEFLDLVRFSADRAKDKNMLLGLYDEDRWPSGSAGGMVTKDIRLRQRSLRLTRKKLETVSLEEAYACGKPALLAAYRVELNEKGQLRRYERADTGEDLLYAYYVTSKPSGFYNGQTYIDVMQREPMDRFLAVTHEKYKMTLGEEFGKTVSLIYADEPRFTLMHVLERGIDTPERLFPWTHDLPESFRAAYGFDILAHLPELLWDWENRRPSRARYCFHDHCCERFAQSYAKTYGQWCAENGIASACHMAMEGTLEFQTRSIGEAMRFYPHFAIPGIDMLYDRIELATAKQCQSVVHQQGKEALFSEEYGVTNWDFDFRGHKFQGDWQAALGVNHRVLHLAWMSMKGANKRDYPASIGYQSPWHEKYAWLEDHFARVNTAMTRGRPLCDVAVIHPIESFWLHFGPRDSSGMKQKQLDENLVNVMQWLLFGQIDFDFISEALLPDQLGQIGRTLEVGEMGYRTVIVPALETIRTTTLETLERFREQGGKVVFLGNIPGCVDAVPSDRPRRIAEKCTCVQMTRADLLEAVEEDRFISVWEKNGTRAEDLMYALRQDNDCRWLFLVHGIKGKKPDLAPRRTVTLELRGEYRPEVYDTMTGDCYVPAYAVAGGMTRLDYDLYDGDSLLLKLLPPQSLAEEHREADTRQTLAVLDFKDKVRCVREEPNVLLLDMARWRVEDGQWQEREEIRRIDSAVRTRLGLPAVNGFTDQPWATKDRGPSYYVTLAFDIESRIRVEDVYLALEEGEKITLRGEPVPRTDCGWYVDEAIRKVRLGTLLPGINTLTVTVPVSRLLTLESMYLLGEFGVCVEGTRAVITEDRDMLAFSPVGNQGLPFYSGNLCYEAWVDTPACEIEAAVSCYRGALVTVSVDDGEEIPAFLPPYRAELGQVSEGRHKLSFRLYGNRYNTFAALHRVFDYGGDSDPMWYTTGDDWSYEYRFKDLGILKSPVITLKK